MSETRMAGLSWIKRTIEGIINRARLANTPAGGVVQFDAPGQIRDGVPYAMPVVVPYAIRDNPEAVAAFTQDLQESVAAEFQHQFGTPYPKGGPFRMPTVSQPLTEWTYTIRRYVLEQCHLAWERNPVANTAVFYNRAFSVQNGASITYKNKEVERICEAFIKHPENDLRDLEKNAVDQLFVDGEVFLRFFKGDGIEGAAGETIVVPLEPWGITGIKTAVGFRKRIEFYRHRITQRDGDDDISVPIYVDEEIPAADVHHIAINRMGYELRGRPMMFVMLPWLQAHKEWLENRARQNFWRGAILFWVKLVGALPSQVASKLNTYRQPPRPGSVVVSNDKEEWSQFAPNVGASDASEDGRQFRAMAAAGARIPESWLSDGANANLATAKAQAIPAVMSFGEFQDIMIGKFWNVLLKRRIQNAIDAGDLPDMVEVQDADGDPVKATKPISALEAFEATYSELGANDVKNVVDAVLAAEAAQVISMKTARGLMPWPIVDAAEEKQLDLEREKQLDLMAQGLVPMPFGATSNDPNNPNSNGDMNNGSNQQKPGQPSNGNNQQQPANAPAS